VIPIETWTTSTAGVLTGDRGSKTLVACHLRLAKAAPKQPVVILMHGVGGVGPENGLIGTWSRVFNEAGISVCALDSYAGRGIKTLPEAQKLSFTALVLDTFATREVLSRHTLVDPDRIAVMGFSAGSPAAIYSNLERFQKMYGSGKFAAHVSVYGLCGSKYHEDEKMVSPMLFLHGTADDWVPAAPCREYTSRLKNAGKDVRMIEYPDAHHVFDAPATGPVRKMANVATAAWCRFAETDNGVVINTETRMPPSPQDACRRMGPSLGYNEAAMKKAHEDVIRALKDVFKM
jgi:dienelactone hydrolase